MPSKVVLKLAKQAGSSDAVSSHSHSSSSSIASSLSHATTAIKNAVVKGSAGLTRLSKRAQGPGTGASIDLTRSGSESDIEPSADANAPLDDDNDLAAELEALKKTWRSPIYTFFSNNVEAQHHNGRPCHFFPCAARKCKTALGGVRRYQDTKDKSSTTNLKHHAIGCFGEDAVNNALKGKDAPPNSGSIFAAFARQGQQPVHYAHRTHSNPEVVAHLVKWVTECNRPASIVNDRELRELLTAGRPHIEIPSPDTLMRKIHLAFDKASERIGKLLKNYSGRLHFATDAWTSPNHRAFIAWTVHLEYEGQMFSFLLDIVEVAESHTGSTMAMAFQSMLERFGLTEKILAVNADNAAANNTQFEKLATLNNAFHAANRVHCFNHTLQLCAKALLKPFGATSSHADDEGDAPLLLLDDDVALEFESEFTPDQDDVDDMIDELNVLSDTDREQQLNDTLAVKTTISKIRGLAFAIVRSTTILLPAWRRTCAQYRLRPNLIPRDVATRWNSTYDMLSFAIRYQTPIDHITSDKSLKQAKKFELDDEEWQIVTDLVSVLGQYKKATLFFSQDSATVAAVIPAMDKLDSKMNRQTKEPLHSAVVSAMQLAKNKMDRYWQLTDLSRIYRIAMVLHPGLKLEYFRKQAWEEEWIETAEELVRTEFTERYQQLEKMPDRTDVVTTTNVDLDDDFADYAIGTASAPVISELDEFLRLPTVNTTNPLSWWHHNRHTYPTLHRMALDYLSVPATSTAVERVFSQGRQLLHFTRNRLLPSTIRAFLCLGAWGRNDLLVMEDILGAVRDRKRKRDEIETVEEKES